MKDAGWKRWYIKETHPRFPNGTLKPVPKHHRGDPEIHLLRIQKTGGTTFGERVMPHFCGIESRWCSYLLHTEWLSSTNKGAYQGNVVTFLRHPVERTLSEFYHLRTIDGMWTANQPQWDFQGAIPWLMDVQREGSPERALMKFLEGFKHSPVRNRQALYLIGFDRDVVRMPGELYDWEGNHTGLLQLAKEHLNRTLFGITDCYNTSVRVITERLGWNTTQAQEVSSSVKFRKTDVRTHMTKASFMGHTKLADLLNQTLVNHVSMAWNHTRPRGTWRGTFPEKIVNYIENYNAVDMELYEYALWLFKEKYNATCV